MMSSCGVAAIIPARNEAQTVALVVAAARACPLVYDVVVVSDASTDTTAEGARQAGARVIESHEPLGKGMALKRGVEATSAGVLLFLDADLRGLTADHITSLLTPVCAGSHAMMVGLRDRGRWSRWVEPHLPLVSGERALRRELFTSLPDDVLAGYRVEVALNLACRKRGWKAGSVFFDGVHIRTKVEKVGWWRALWQYVGMWSQVAGAYLRGM